MPAASTTTRAAKKSVTKPMTHAAPKKAAAAKKPAPAAKPATKPAAKPAAKAAASAAPAQGKPAKPKLVRDSFTIPKSEYAVLDTLKLRAARLARPAKKSELLRAGIKALAAMNDAAFLKVLESVPAIKTGRPKGKKAAEAAGAVARA